MVAQLDAVTWCLLVCANVVQKADGLGDAEAVVQKQNLERIQELVTCPAFSLRVFVIGIGGRIGSAVARACLARGATVSGLARRATSTTEALLSAPFTSVATATTVDSIYYSNVLADDWAKHLAGCDAVVCALRGMPGEVLPLQIRALELAREARVPRFVAADFLPDYTAPQTQSAQEHPMLIERIEFRKYVLSLNEIAGVHMHVGCLLEVDELFGFMGIFNAETRELSYWGNERQPFDVTTILDAAEATAQALFTGKVGDVRVATATVSIHQLAAELSSFSATSLVAVKCNGSLVDLQNAIKNTPPNSLEHIRLCCQRSLFAGDCKCVDAGVVGLKNWLSSQKSLHGLPTPWTTPDMTSAGLIQIDLKTDGANGDAALWAKDLSSLEFEEAWLELARRALTTGRWAEVRLVSQVIEAVDETTLTSGKLWLAGVACFFTGHFAEGVERFDTEMAANPVDAEEILWRELCALAGGLQVFPPASIAHLASPDPRAIFNSILAYFGGELSRTALLEFASTPLDRFYASMYVALHLQAMGEESSVAQQLLGDAQRQNCRDNLGLACSHMRMLPYVQLGVGGSGTYSCPRLIIGCAGMAVDDATSVARLQVAANRGAWAVDVADIYPGAEQLANLAGSRIVHTKYVPDRASLATLQASTVHAAMMRSLARLGRRPHAMQLHWWGDIDSPTEMAQLALASRLLEKARVEDKLFRCLGVTNMDAVHLQVVCDNAHVGLAQVALSLLDRRPQHGGLLQFCRERSISVVAYGVLAGGFLSEKWLGVPEPDSESVAPAQLKYLARIRVQGGWAEFQQLLRLVGEVARRHRTRFATVAIAWALRHAAAVIVGCPGLNDGQASSERADQLDAALAALNLVLAEDDIRLLARPPPQDLVAEDAPSSTKTAPGVYIDERDALHPIGAALAPWQNTAQLGLSPAQEAIGRAEADPRAIFVREEMAALGLQAEHTRLLHGDSLSSHGRIIDCAGVATKWRLAGLELEAARREGGTQRRQLSALAMAKVGQLATTLAEERDNRGSDADSAGNK